MQVVAKLQPLVRRRHHQQLPAFEARTDDRFTVEQRHLLDRHALQIRVAHRHVHGVQQLTLIAQAAFKRLRLALDVDAENSRISHITSRMPHMPNG